MIAQGPARADRHCLIVNALGNANGCVIGTVQVHDVFGTIGIDQRHQVNRRLDRLVLRPVAFEIR